MNNSTLSGLAPGWAKGNNGTLGGSSAIDIHHIIVIPKHSAQKCHAAWRAQFTILDVPDGRES